MAYSPRGPPPGLDGLPRASTPPRRAPPSLASLASAQTVATQLRKKKRPPPLPGGAHQTGYAMAVAQPMAMPPPSTRYGGGAMAVAQPMAMPMAQPGVGYGGGAMAVAQPMAMAVATPMAMPTAAMPVAVAQPGYGQAAVATAAVAAPHQAGGVHYLAAYGDLFIKQRVELLEVVTGFETANAYDILGTQNGQTEPLFFAGEQSDCCTRQCCGSNRCFEMAVFSATNASSASTPLMTFERPLRNRPPGCCCYLQEIKVFNEDGAARGESPIGRLMQNYSCCGSAFSVLVGGVVQFKISGPVCICDGPCCGDQQFFITTGTSGQHIETPAGPARITKMGGAKGKGFEGMVQEAVSDADNFGCTFPPGASPEAKAVLLAAVFLIDFLFFEDSAGEDGPAMGFGDD